MIHKYKVLSLQTLLDKYNENLVVSKMKEYECPLNQEVHVFFRGKPIESVKKHQTATFVVSSLKKNLINGFYTLTHKSLEVSGENLSFTTRKRLERYAEFDEETNTYQLSAFLIAQFGLNYNRKVNRSLTGDELMELVFNHLHEIQGQIAGSLVYLECEDKEKLITFDKRNGFVLFGERYSKKENVQYKQLLRFL